MLRYLLAGESHGPALVGILEGFPAGLALRARDVDVELARRLEGHGRGVRARSIEDDRVTFLAGLWHGRTLGSPIAFTIPNRDHELRKGKGAQHWHVPRPGHADLPGLIRHGFADCAPVAERASARGTAALTAAGACAKILLKEFGITVLSHVRAVGGVQATATEATLLRLRRIRSGRPLRCLDRKAERAMVEVIDRALADGVSVGGEFEVVAFGVPAGLGTYDHPDRRLDGLLAGDVAAIPAVKAVSLGGGLEAAAADGQTAHDELFPAPEPTGNRRPRNRPSDGGKPDLDPGFVRTTNRAGGLEGGVTNGEPVVVRGFVKPIASQRRALRSVDLKTGRARPATWVRSDTCVVPAAGVVAEAAVAWRLACELTSFLGGAGLAVMKRRFRDLT